MYLNEVYTPTAVMSPASCPSRDVVENDTLEPLLLLIKDLVKGRYHRLRAVCRVIAISQRAFVCF